jgi:outer membrane receptor protein involved in Fe transport
MVLGLLRGLRPYLAALPAVVACVLTLGPLALGGTTGKISGVVTDDATGQPIAGAVVRVAGTPLSAVTDAVGRYTILNVPVGKHTLVASMLGEEESPAETELLLFQAIEVQDLKVSVDLDTQTDITLSSKPVEMGTIVVIAERPVVIPDRTASLRIVDSEQIQSLPTRGYRDIVALQPGVVVRTGNLLNVRGGRTSEVAYFVDGFSQQDPLTGVSTTQINNNDLEEVSVVTGGFNAEYGWIASGAVNVTTKGGTDRLSGTFEAVTDNFHGANYDYNVYNGSLAGPLSGISDDIKFIVSAERRYRGDRTPSTVGGDVPDDHESGWTFRGKTNWRLSSTSELRLGGLTSIDRWDVFLNAWRFNPEHAPRLEDKNQSFYATFERVLSPKTFYTLSGNYFMTERERGDGVYFDNIWGYGRPGVSSSYDETDLFYSWDDINGATPTEDTVINGRTYTVRGDEAAVWNNYLHRRSSYVGAKFDVTSQVTQFHELKSGVEFQRHTLRRYQHLWPTRVWMEDNGGFVDVDRYGYDETGQGEEDGGLQGAKHPITMAAYLQDKFELEGMVINAGLRLDYFDVNTKRLRSEENPLDPDGYGDNPAATPEQKQLAQELDDNDLEDSRAETAVSPRLGLAFPVADGSVFHAAYGRFMQRPDLQNLYVSYDFLEYKIKNGGYFFPFGNPNLRPERTIAYEVGWTRQLGRSTSFDVTAYYKDVKDLTQVVNQPATPFSFSTYRNADYGTIKGVELRFDMRRIRNVGLQASYALSSATGTGSDANSQSNIAWMAGETPLTPSPLDHDQRHKFVGIFDLQFGPDEGPAMGNSHPFANTGLNVTFQASSGFPYTPTEVWNEVTLASNRGPLEGAVNSRYSDWRMQTDLKATKSFWVAGTRMEFSLWIINLFNTENIIGVFQSTGLANSTGWLETAEGQAFRDAYDEAHDSSGLTGEQKYRLRENDPNNYDVPRQVRAGLKVSF